jgi:TfoX/Sxy family transcriptional regulator of competence genes
VSTASDAMAGRVRPMLSRYPQLVEKKMFGGIGFMLDGNMAVGTTAKGALLVRVDPDKIDGAIEKGAEIMHMGPRAMTGFVFVDAAALSDKALKEWVAYSLTYAKTLPPK